MAFLLGYGNVRYVSICFRKEKLVVNMIIFYYKHFLYMLYKFLCLIPLVPLPYFFFCNENDKSQFCKKAVTYCNMIRFC